MNGKRPVQTKPTHRTISRFHLTSDTHNHHRKVGTFPSGLPPTEADHFSRCIYQGSEFRRQWTRILPPSDGGVEVPHLGDLRRQNHLDDHLCNVATELHGEVWLRVVEEHSATRPR